jgi:capsular polysaccharide biosynthesis protein
MADYRILATALNDALSVLDSSGRRVHNVTFNVLNTSTLAQKVASEQIREFHRWQVVIATHGAFEGNVIFFREGTLLVEICGKEPRRWTEQCRNYRHLSNLFLVFHRMVKAADLREERQDKYSLAKNEVDHVVAIVVDYLSQKPWIHVKEA